MKKLLFLIGLSISCGFTSYAQSVLYGATKNTISKYSALTNSLTASYVAPSEGANPTYSSLTKASNGKYYGMTTGGGVNNNGVIFSLDPTTNTYSKLKDFDYASGGSPFGSLIQASDGKLYGMTVNGGTNGAGVIFSFDPTTNVYSKLKDFDYTNGGSPYGSLVQATDGKLYGMTYSGGTSGAGVIFSFEPATIIYTKLKDFDGTNGSSPFGSLVQAADGKFYGVTNYGGTSGYGVIFSFDPATSAYNKLKDFDYTNGSSPYGSLVQAADGKFYGTAVSGGTSGNGVIFSFDPATSTYNKLKDFDYTNGSYAYGSLVQAADGKLYGMTNYGGTNGRGVIFSLDPTTNIYGKLKDFDGTNGGSPQGSLVITADGKFYGMAAGGSNNFGVIFYFDPGTATYTKVKEFDNRSLNGIMRASNGKLYGMTNNGGTSGAGVIFSFDPTTNTYSKLKDFDYTNGGYPYSSLVQASDGKLYGMTTNGGTSGYGVIFSFDPATSTYNKLKDFDGTNGGNSFGSLVKGVDSKLYGMTYSGGANSAGVIFSFDPTTNIYTKLKDFDGTNGSSPNGSLVQATDGKFYGVTNYGGTSGNGVIFSFDPATITYNKLKDFDYTNGSSPNGSLVQPEDGKLYGMTSYGGTSGKGVIFSFDPTTNTYGKLKDFDGTNGGSPFGSLVKGVDTKLYGMTYFGGSNNLGVLFSFDPATNAYTKQDFDGTNGASPQYSTLVETSTCKPPTVIATFENQSGAVVPKTMNFNAGGDVTFVGQGPGAKKAGGRTNIYSAINTAAYSGLWWTFYPIENPRHSSQGSTSTGQMAFSSYDAATGIITFVSTANMTWPANSGTENITTRLRMQLQPYTGSHSGPLASGWITPVTAGDISLASLPANYPLIDIKATGNPGKFQVWYSIETGSGVPLDDYYATYPHTSIAGGSTITSVTGSFYERSASTCNGGPVKVTVTASGGVEPYTGMGVFYDQPGSHTYTVSDKNGCTGSTTVDVQPQNCGAVTCPSDKTVDADGCTATVSGIDPNITPSGAAVTYTLSGATTGSGSGSASGQVFNIGTTVVTYTAVDDGTKTCSFNVIVNDKADPVITTCPGDQTVCTTNGQTTAPVEFSAVATDNCTTGLTIKYYNGETEVASGDAFPVGETIITVRAVDAAGNKAECSFKITVKSPVTYYLDNDHDGFGDPATGREVCSDTPPENYVTNSDDVDDNKITYADNDGDGYGAGPMTPSGVDNNSDCNDNDADEHPGQTWYIDGDGDGYAGSAIEQCTRPIKGYLFSELSGIKDCDDADRSVWRAATFYKDADGDGYTVGDGVSLCYGESEPAGYSTTRSTTDDCDDNNKDVWRTGTFYRDGDGDGYTMGSGESICYGNTTPSGYRDAASTEEDCNDANSSIGPKSLWYLDKDNDGYYTGSSVLSCTSPGEGYKASGLIAGGDCSDDNAARHPGATEACNGVDDDCDGLTDEDCPSTVTKSLKVNLYGGVNPYTIGGWNNWNVSANNVSITSANYNYSDGTPSTINSTISGSHGVPDNGAAYGGTMCPPEVLRYTSYSASRRTLTFKGLNNALKYDLEFYDSRGTTGNSTIFTIGGVNKSVVTDNNKANKVVYSDLVPIGGQLIVTLNMSGSFNYLNGFILTEKSTTVGGNQVPVARAGGSKTITLPTSSVQADGSASFDPDGTIVHYHWNQVGENLNAATIVSPDGATTQIQDLKEGFYKFLLTVTDNGSAVARDTLYVTVNPHPVITTKSMKVNLYGGANPYTVGGWNNWNVSANNVSITSANYNYSDGSASTINGTLSGSHGVPDNGATYGGIMCPPEVLRYTSYSASKRTLTFKGLNNALKYDLEFYDSRGTTGNTTIFIINGVSQSVVTDNNKANKVVFSDLVPSGGQLVVTLNMTGSFNYLNGFILTEKTPSSGAPTVGSGIKKDREVQAFNQPFVLSTLPNPFQAVTRIQYTVPVAAHVSIKVYDLLGREVGQVMEGNREPGTYSVEYNAHKLASGVYYCRMVAVAGDKNITQTQKMIKAE